MQGFEYIK